MNEPTYHRSNCPACASFTDRGFCDQCSSEFTPDAASGFGYEAQSINHWHFKNVEGVGAREAIHRKLCRNCYREDFQKIYPGEALPV